MVLNIFLAIGSNATSKMFLYVLAGCRLYTLINHKWSDFIFLVEHY